MKKLKKIAVEKAVNRFESGIYLTNQETDERIGEIFGEGASISPGRQLEISTEIMKRYNNYEKLVYALEFVKGVLKNEAKGKFDGITMRKINEALNIKTK